MNICDVVILNYNTKNIIPNKGSAIFIHLTNNYKPTAGCIALKRKDFLIFAKIIHKKSKIKISIPEHIKCRIKSTIPNLELSYRGVSLSALILPKHVANYHKYMKPIKIIDKSNLLLCPMPGKLIKVLVQENNFIEEGQALCVVEAMKMENTLLAEKKCVINKIYFQEGDTLSVDETIMEFVFEKKV